LLWTRYEFQNGHWCSFDIYQFVTRGCPQWSAAIALDTGYEPM